MIEQLLGHPIYIATKKIQRKKHRKARINKKWQKRYGYVEYNLMPHGQVMMMGGAIYMTEKTYRELWFIQKEQTDAT